MQSNRICLIYTAHTNSSLLTEQDKSYLWK